MKTTAITRIVGVEGKYVIPVEIRRSFEIKHNDYIEIYLEADKKNCHGEVLSTVYIL